MRLINIENQTNPGTLSPTELKLLIEALQLQSKQFNDSPWVEHDYCEPIEVKSLSEKPPVGSWNLILVDNTEVKGALGYHEDINGGKIPISYCTVKEAREDDVAPSEVASHELMEMAVDPFVTGNDLRIVKHENKEWIVEIADPLESCGYRVLNGQLVANFVWPKWFGLPQTRPNYCQVGTYAVKAFQLTDTGYISTRADSSGEWSQTFGYKRTSLPPWADRLPRIGAA